MVSALLHHQRFELPGGKWFRIKVFIFKDRLPNAFGVDENVIARIGQSSGRIEINLKVVKDLKKEMNNDVYFRNFIKFIILWCVLKIDWSSGVSKDRRPQSYPVFPDMDVDKMCVDWFRHEKWDLAGVLVGFSTLYKLDPRKTEFLQKRATEVAKAIGAASIYKRQ